MSESVAQIRSPNDHEFYNDPEDEAEVIEWGKKSI